MIELCVSKFMSYFEHLTEELLKQMYPPIKPVVGESPIVSIITNVKKGNFVIVAHAGAGKTTLGLLLYHKARLRELADNNVIYINAREFRNLIGSHDFYNNLLKAIFNEQTEIGKKAREEGVIFSSVTGLNIDCNTPENCIEEVRKRGLKLILFIDELERAVETIEAVKYVVEWFIATRRIYDKTLSIPIKVVVAFPKIISIVRTIEEFIKKSGGEATYVFTEFREYAINSQILWDYFHKLNHAMQGSLRSLVEHREFKELINILGLMISGRFSIPALRKAIALSICKCIEHVFNPAMNIDDILKLVQNKKLPVVNIYDVVDPILVGIAEGKPFKQSPQYDMRTLISMWRESATSLCRDLGSAAGAISYSYLHYICKPAVSTTGLPVLWLTFAKSIGTDDVKTIISKVSETLVEHGEQPSVITLLILIPEFTKGLISTQSITHSITREEGARKRTISIRIDIRSRRLGIDELISLAYKGNQYLQIDSLIADLIYKELLEEIKSPRSWY